MFTWMFTLGLPRFTFLWCFSTGYRFEYSTPNGCGFKSVTGNLVENSSAVRIELFNGVNTLINILLRVCIV